MLAKSLYAIMQHHVWSSARRHHDRLISTIPLTKPSLAVQATLPWPALANLLVVVAGALAIVVSSHIIRVSASASAGVAGVRKRAGMAMIARHAVAVSMRAARNSGDF